MKLQSATIVTFAVAIILLFGFASCEEKQEERKKEEHFRREKVTEQHQQKPEQQQERKVELDVAKPKLIIIELGTEQHKPSLIQVLEGSTKKTPTKLEEQRMKEEKLSKSREEQESKEESSEEEQEVSSYKPNLELLGTKSETLLALETFDFYEKNPETKFQQECYADKMKEGVDSIDFVIDLAASPSKDEIDSRLANSPVSLHLQEFKRNPSRTYFGAVEIFIETVTQDMKPKVTHTVLYDNGRKFYIRGRDTKDRWPEKKQEFSDSRRNLATLFPSPTNTMSESCFRDFVKNNLGHVTKMALWNRANGLPTVLSESRHSKPFYTIVITDGASGAKLDNLTSDLSRTTLIDLGNRRFLDRLDWDQMKRLANVYELSSPQLLLNAVNTCRMWACRFASHRD